MRLLARLYADGPTPSKVSIADMSIGLGMIANRLSVVVEFHKAQVHGKVSIECRINFHCLGLDILYMCSVSPTKA